MSQKYQVIVQPEAQQGIEEAYLWFSNDSPRTARLWLEGLYKAILSLKQMPYRCSLAFENNFLEQEIRQLIYGKGRNAYRILFTITGDTCRFFSCATRHKNPCRSKKMKQSRIPKISPTVNKKRGSDLDYQRSYSNPD